MSGRDGLNAEVEYLLVHFTKPTWLVNLVLWTIGFKPTKRGGSGDFKLGGSQTRSYVGEELLGKTLIRMKSHFVIDYTSVVGANGGKGVILRSMLWCFIPWKVNSFFVFVFPGEWKGDGKRGSTSSILGLNSPRKGHRPPFLVGIETSVSTCFSFVCTERFKGSQIMVI